MILIILLIILESSKKYAQQVSTENFTKVLSYSSLKLDYFRDREMGTDKPAFRGDSPKSFETSKYMFNDYKDSKIK